MKVAKIIALWKLLISKNYILIYHKKPYIIGKTMHTNEEDKMGRLFHVIDGRIQESVFNDIRDISTGE